ncbi:hypothetical protein QAD02_012098 [Eretmocerus hayati]|uniref:Uncharacterized protein n=1 Tax=Eretmocerus hayati TaxID=131215 RepID=A0ACC2NYS7_9HYME|nr:hypothetical protein QAD02_012098 [Eretmocerus hayati]
MAIEPQVVEHFFGVYLLYCKNPRFKGRTYIGYTVDPRRRIKQHNAGKDFGGAWRTSNKGPWEMVLIVHGFPNSTSALRFEWAWQHPELSRRLRHVPKKKSREKRFDYCLLVLSEMLRVGPWSRLPLTLRWLDDDFGQRYATHVRPPMHMPVTFGKVASKNNGKRRIEPVDAALFDEAKDSIEEPQRLCNLCGKTVLEKESIVCVKTDCGLVAHLTCLAARFAEAGTILPVEGICPFCNTCVLWGDLIRKKIGCNMHLNDDDLNEPCDSDD